MWLRPGEIRGSCYTKDPMDFSWMLVCGWKFAWTINKGAGLKRIAFSKIAT